MKKTLSFRQVLVVTALISVISCKNEFQDLNAIDEAALKSANVENKIRLLEDKGLSDGFLQGYRYNELGLADEYYLSKTGQYNFWATMEYDSNKRMSKARFYYDADIYFDIVFTYEKDKLVKETWYVPGTEEVVDYYINTYNNKGQLVRRDEPPFQLRSEFQYDNVGNLTVMELIWDDGSLLYGMECSFSGPLKNPFASVTGLPVAIIWADDNNSSPNRFTGLKYYYNDEDGNKVIDFNWESDETIINIGSQHYPIYQNSLDVISDTWADQTWTYEKSAGKSASSHNWVNSVAQNPASTDVEYYKLKLKALKQNVRVLQLKH